jgi:SET domain-containing protein
MNMAQRPKWTFMNHSKRAPTARMVLPRRGLGISWLATRDVAAGEELTFNYGPQDSDDLDD